MNNVEKALMYDTIVREGQRLNTERNNLKSVNGGINLSNENLEKIRLIDERLLDLDNKLLNLMK